MVASGVVPKDVVIAVMGTAAALAGFILVFLGVVIGDYASYDTTQKGEVRTAYRWEGGLAMMAFLLSVAAVALGLRWLAYGQSGTDYRWMIRFLFVDLALVVLLGAVATIQALRD
jgi:uncharacterized membrane protein